MISRLNVAEINNPEILFSHEVIQPEEHPFATQAIYFSMPLTRFCQYFFEVFAT